MTVECGTSLRDVFLRGYISEKSLKLYLSSQERILCVIFVTTFHERGCVKLQGKKKSFIYSLSTSLYTLFILNYFTAKNL
jgi:hypothetical protein